jgi:hypothetical protein
MRLFNKYKKIFFVLGMISLLWGIIPNLKAFDERLFRYQLKKDAWKEEKQTFKSKYKWSVSSALYELDINQDSYKEYLQYSKRDGEDWFIIRNFEKKTIFKTKLDTFGSQSRVYKVNYYKIGKDIWLLIIFHYQGMTKFRDFYGASKLYFITLEGHDYRNIYLKEGPSIWEEKELFPHWYYQRKYDVAVRDMDGDEIRDVDVFFRDIHTIFSYKKQGKWMQL